MPQPCDEQAMAQLELYAHLEQQAAAISPILAEIEIDSVADPDLGSLCRVWRGMKLVGTFYRNLDGFWVSQPLNSNQRQRWASDKEAVSAILAA